VLRAKRPGRRCIEDLLSRGFTPPICACLTLKKASWHEPMQRIMGSGSLPSGPG